MIKYIFILISGMLFSFGLVISNMINPNVVLNFLDIFGDWDPSLIFVMSAALLTSSIGYKIIFKQSSPLFDSKFHTPKIQNFDIKLISGSIIFGIGWGLSGYCPGPIIASLSYGKIEIIAFVLAMLCGFKVSQIL